MNSVAVCPLISAASHVTIGTSPYAMSTMHGWLGNEHGSCDMHCFLQDKVLG